MQIVTVATMRTLARARALVASLGRTHPDWPVSVMLIGDEAAIERTSHAEPALSIDSVSKALELDVETLLARHDEEDLAILLLPHLLLRRLEQSAQPVIHLPSSAWVLGGLDPLATLVQTSGVVLVPRLLVDLPDDGLEPNREELERFGRIDPTVMAVDATPGARDFLRWWAARVEQALGSLDALSVGDRPEDRPWLSRFLELAPARFATGVLEDPGCNLSLWNLDRHALEDTSRGVVVDGSAPLRFLNLPGFDPDRPYRLAANASRARISRSGVLRRLCQRYGEELRASGWDDAERRHEVGRRLFGGLVYDDAFRSIYGRALALGQDFGELFDEPGSRAFLAWLEQPAPRGGRHGINRYLFYRVSRERPDVLRAYPDLDNDDDGAGFVAWCWAFGRAELAIPDRFMPPWTGKGQTPAAQSASQPGERSAQQVRSAKSAGEGRRQAISPERWAGRTTGASGDELAVRLTGYMGHTLGLGAAARGYAKALAAVNVPVSTVSVPLHHLALPVALGDEYGRHGFDDVVHRARHGFELVAVNADELPGFVDRLGESYWEGPRIGIWGWETNAIPARWRRAFELVAEIWVYSRYMAENIGAQAPVPVLALPPPVQRPPQPVATTRLGVPDGYLFLFVFDYLSTIQRKDPVALIEAFKAAFEPGEGPQLLIKTINAPLRPLSEEEVLWAAHGRGDVHVIDRSLDPAELNGLMAGCDCYVSLHRAEGFGLTLAEAMAIGKPAIATGYSGNVDFMNDANSYLVDFTIGRVGPECEIYPPEGEWAQPSVEHAARLMRHVYENPNEAAAKGERAAADVARLLSPEAVGGRMRERLEQLADLARGSLLPGVARATR
ncbi:MAG TPA: glycosyltransferase [Solirubrobacteraceae bacterium]|jgi:glycosyltransferase involved in cell wall biosynthesis